MPAICESIVKTLAYFDLFQYPLTEEEIKLFLDRETTQEEFKTSLQGLLAEKYIFRIEEYYSLQNNTSIITRRKKGNSRAAALLATARRIAAFLYRFPYIRGIGISGSLSKNYADENTDIDYFIITQSNRLWIARTLMHVFKKFTFITGHQHWYCMNYYLDEAALQIEEKNYYTAIEVATLLPVSGRNCVAGFYEANAWVKNYFPNYIFSKDNQAPHKSIIKKWVEFIFNDRAGNWLDNILMKLTTRRWNKKMQRQQLNMNGNRMGIKTGKHFCRPCPEFLQRKILTAYHQKLSELKIQWDKVLE